MIRRTATVTTADAHRQILLYPGGYAVSASNSAFYASGVIKSITVDVLGSLVEVSVYDMVATAGGPLTLGAPAKRYHIDTSIGTPTAFKVTNGTIDPYEEVKHGETPVTPHAGISGLGADAVRWTSTGSLVALNGTKHFDGLDIRCPTGMAVFVDQKADVGPFTVTVEYVPMTTGRTRRRSAERGVQFQENRTDTNSGITAADPAVITLTNTVAQLPKSVLDGQTWPITLSGTTVTVGNTPNIDGDYLATIVDHTAGTLSIPLDTSGDTITVDGSTTFKANIKVGQGLTPAF